VPRGTEASCAMLKGKGRSGGPTSLTTAIKKGEAMFRRLAHVKEEGSPLGVDHGHPNFLELR
jgi:hypothetical protein